MPRTCLDLLLTDDGGFHRVLHFVVNQQVNMLFACKAINQVALVLPHTAYQVGSHSGIKRPIRFAGQNVDRRLLVGHGAMMPVVVITSIAKQFKVWIAT